MLHFFIVGILVILTSFLTYFGASSFLHMPVAASAQAIPIDWLWDLQIKVMSFLFALVIVPMFYSLFVFRSKKGDTSDGEHFEGNTPLEIAWTILPLMAVVTMAYIGAGNLADVKRADPEAMVINVTGSQWAWKFEYENGVVSDELHAPEGKQILLKMTSRDVLHSFWVPEFRVKQDLVPGRTTELRITPDLIGEYQVRCAELCGTSHAFMRAPVIVSSQADFDVWMGEQVALAAALDTPEGRGEALANANGCAACHSVDGSAGLGPTWLGLAGSQTELSDGSVVEATDEYLYNSIADPASQIVAGFETQQMPVFGFNEEQISDLVAYIKTIK